MYGNVILSFFFKGRRGCRIFLKIFLLYRDFLCFNLFSFSFFFFQRKTHARGSSKDDPSYKGKKKKKKHGFGAHIIGGCVKG